jgi:hypothetical protein
VCIETNIITRSAYMEHRLNFCPRPLASSKNDSKLEKPESQMKTLINLPTYL